MREKRRYVRMNTVFPVELEFKGTPAGETGPNILQGFTRDVSEGGICVELKTFDPETENLLNNPSAELALTINPTFSKKPVKAQGKVVWVEKIETDLRGKYLFGVRYLTIDEKARRRIIRYAKRLRWLPRLAVLTIVLLAGFLGVLFFHNQYLVRQNEALVAQLLQSAEKRSGVTEDLYELQGRKLALEKQLSEAGRRVESLEASAAALAAENISQKHKYEKDLAEAFREKEAIEEQLHNVRVGSDELESIYRDIKRKEAATQTLGLRQMFEWVRSHQNLRTGLVASFEGDPQLEDWGFTYDQSLAAQVFLLFNETEAAKRILRFYKENAERRDGVFFNAYDVVDGRVAEATVHVGPNLWMGITALQYEKKAGTGEFLMMARRLGDWGIRMQDEEGGLKGGPDVGWYSTEHNLDAYAFFRMLHLSTGDNKYKVAAEKVVEWLKKYAYSNKDKRIYRGKGDATIATDTFSWAIAALGPEKLEAMGFDAEGIIEFAEEHCGVTVTLAKPGGETGKVQGFDFAKAQHIARGGIVSTEWTAQMIVTYKILADYFASINENEKSLYYRRKRDFYLSELQQMMITSPSRTGQGRGCLPYASHDNADTGHGWRTPAGKRTGSVAGTAYGIFAWMDYNPFELNNSR